MTPPAKSGSHLSGKGAAADASKRHITAPAPKLTITAAEQSMMAAADTLHNLFIIALNASHDFYVVPERCAKQYVAQWVDALWHDNPAAYDVVEANLTAFYSEMSEGEKLTESANDAAVNLCNLLSNPDYVTNIKAMGADGFAAFSKQVQGLGECLAGRQWIRMQIRRGVAVPNPYDEVPTETQYFPGSDDPNFIHDQSVWDLISDADTLQGLLTEIAPRDPADKTPKDQVPEADSAWMELTEKSIDGSFFPTLAEFGGILADEKKEEYLDEVIKLLAPRIGLVKGTVKPDELADLRDKFTGKAAGSKALLLEKDVLVQATIGEKQLISKIQVFDTTKAVWEGLNVSAESVAKCLVVVNSASAIMTFAKDPNIKNGVGAAGAMTSIMGAFVGDIQSWYREGRVLTTDQAKTQALLAEAAEAADKVAAEGGALKFISHKVGAPEGGKIVPILGVVQGLFDAVSGFWEAIDAAKEGNTAGAISDAVVGTGGVLMAVGSAMILVGEGSSAVGAVPLGAALFVIGTIAELVGSIVGHFFPSRTEFQKWVRKTPFGPAPEGTLEELIEDLNKIVYGPDIDISASDTGISVKLTIKGLDRRCSRIPSLTMVFDQDDAKSNFQYSPLQEGMSYSSPAPKFNYDDKDTNSLVSIVFDVNTGGTAPLTVSGEVICDPQGAYDPLTFDVTGTFNFPLERTGGFRH